MTVSRQTSGVQTNVQSPVFMGSSSLAPHLYITFTTPYGVDGIPVTSDAQAIASVNLFKLYHIIFDPAIGDKSLVKVGKNEQ
jgi:hypothetical protein